MKLFLLSAFVTFATTWAACASPGGCDTGDCHPKCQWKCDSPVCNQICEPICDPPRCSTRCQELACAKCTIKCVKPKCEIRCPVKQCEVGRCPECETVCSDPKCSTECTNPVAKCESVCEEPQCDWKCHRPANCPKPKCALVCDKAPNCRGPPAPERCVPGVVIVGCISVQPVAAPPVAPKLEISGPLQVQQIVQQKQ